MWSEVVPKSYPENLIKKDWTKRRNFVPYMEQAFIDRAHDFEVREDDIWIVTLPKCGTTWMQEMVWLLTNDCDFETAKSESLELRSPFLEFADLVGDDSSEYFEELKAFRSPRVIKSHLPLSLLPAQVWTKKPKLIYVFRNPKDALVSLYHFHKNFTQTYGPLIDFIEQRLSKEFETNYHWNHVLDFYELREEPWIHYTSFERMKKDLRSEIEAVCAFLNVRIEEDKMMKLLKHLSFEEMKDNPQCSHLNEIEFFRKRRGIKGSTESRFMRRGEVDSHKDELPAPLIAKLDQWIEDSLRPHNFTLKDVLLL